MGTQQMRAKISILSITVNGVIVPVLNEPVGNLGAAYAGSRKSKTMLLESLAAPKCMITLHQF